MTQPADLVLVFNAGSSSLKFQLFAAGPPLTSRLRGAVHDLGKPSCALTIDDGDREALEAGLGAAEAAERVLDRLLRRGSELEKGRIVVTGHRVVHGGADFMAPTLVTAAVEDRVRSLCDLAPLHNPPALAVMDAVRRRLATVPRVAVFDTAFFRGLPEPAKVYAVPRRWRDELKIERYGFHGIAHEYLATRVAELSHKPLERVLTLQLGQGCSITALLDGKPVDTSMGFTPLEGLIMGTRPGDLDVGAVLHLLKSGVTLGSLEHAMNHESGLLALSTATDDMRELLRLEAQGDRRAQLAIAAFCHRLCKYMGGYAAVLGGVDAIAFGGGIGEHAPSIRARVCRQLEWLGLRLDEAANENAVGSEARLSRPDSRIEVYCVPVREEASIAQGALETLRTEEKA